jgi:hypothetical protein
MQRYIILFFVILLCKSIVAKAENVFSLPIPSLIQRLDKVLDAKESYVQQKVQRIDSLKKQLFLCNSLDEKYMVTTRLVMEYRSYICDSAMKYVDENWKIAQQTRDSDQLNETKFLEANLLLSVGMYQETLEILRSVNVDQLSPFLLKQYYHCCEQTYYHLSNYAGSSKYGKEYKRKSKSYIDSLLLISESNSNEYMRLLARKSYSEGNENKAKEVLLGVLQKYEFGSHDYAVITSTLSEMEPVGEKRKRYLLLSAMSDVMSAVKENKSLRNLAAELYAEGDIERAYHYCTISMDDANFYNARLRSLEIVKIQPIIEKAYKQKVAEQHRRLRIYLIAITGLFVLLMAFWIVLYKQNKKLDKIKVKLQVSNAELSNLNNSLSESNMVKEEYVGRFMSLCSSYISNLKHYQSMVYSKIVVGKIEELKSMVRSSDVIELEIRQFYRSFDEAFLNIYPNFIVGFNTLLREEERIVLPNSRCLTPELRIFALIRLGITDTDRIAKFLQYSTNTVYSYRTKIKNKAIDKTCFDKKILDIG